GPGRPSVAAEAVACLLTVTVASILVISGCAHRKDDAHDRIRLKIGVGTGGPQALQSIARLFSFEPLFTTGLDGRAVARLGDKYEWRDGGRSLWIHVNPGATFHTGERVTSSAVAASIEQSIPAHRDTGLSIWLEHLDSIETPSDSEIVLHMRQPDA